MPLINNWLPGLLLTNFAIMITMIGL